MSSTAGPGVMENTNSIAANTSKVCKLMRMRSGGLRQRLGLRTREFHHRPVVGLDFHLRTEALRKQERMQLRQVVAGHIHEQMMVDVVVDPIGGEDRALPP